MEQIINRNRIALYLKLYEKRIQEAILYLKTKFKTEHPHRAWRIFNIPRVGYLDEAKTIDYSFHGAGCTIGFQTNEIVSFDFDQDYNYSFDKFKFSVFLEFHPDFDYNEIMEQILSESKIIKTVDGFKLIN